MHVYTCVFLSEYFLKDLSLRALFVAGFWNEKLCQACIIEGLQRQEFRLFHVGEPYNGQLDLISVLLKSVNSKMKIKHEQEKLG